MKKYINISFFAFSLVCSAAVWISPKILWIAGFLAYSIPSILLINLLLLFYRLKTRKKNFVYPAIILIIGFGFIQDTFQYNKQNPQHDIKVISYNTKVFNVYENYGKDTASVYKMIEWINNQEADIICLQEFYNQKNSSHYNTLNKLLKSGKYDYYHSPIFTNRAGGEFGQIIFSRFPILNKGTINFNMQTKNIVIYTDIIAGFDTIRIYNMHLQSMHINENDMINSEDLETGFKYITDRLLSGFIQRADQIDILLDNILNCPHSVILCGDLNDLPYSYAYHRLKNKLLNAFAMAGRGFGFTFNGKLFFLRIDNQFYSNDLAIQSFKTHREIKNSDHFPISATYSVSK